MLVGAVQPSGRLAVRMPGADGVQPVAHDERLETSRGYVDADRADTIPIGSHGPGNTATVSLRPEDRSIAVSALLTGQTVHVEAVVTCTAATDVRVTVPLWGRRRHVGVRLRRRELLAAAAVDVDVWTDSVLDPAEHCATIRVEEALTRTLTDTIAVDGATVFVITGDTAAMWLRDSTTQLMPYLRMIGECTPVVDVVAAIVRRQLRQIDHDPFANAFNREPNGNHYDSDDVCEDPWEWEQKYEVDSLAYPVSLAHALWQRTGRTDVFDDIAHRVFRSIVALWRAEQQHEHSTYRFERVGAKPTEILARGGLGSPVAATGMTWGGFRPSDDACTYGDNVPENLFAAQALLAVEELTVQAFGDTVLATEARLLRGEILAGVRARGIVTPCGERIYAFEVDGRGGVLCMDDANMPSLLPLPLLAPDVLDDTVAAATRRFALSPQNPYWFSGNAAAGVGSPHTGPGRVWPIALAVEGLTGTSARRRDLIGLLMATDAGTGRMHVSFSADDPAVFSRPWFSWADSLFCELALVAADD